MSSRQGPERHTRQGCARGQRFGTLDRDLADDPGGQWAATSHTAMAERQVYGPEPSAHLRTIAGHGCWCGQSQGHDWPGKDTGSPHPR